MKQPPTFNPHPDFNRLQAVLERRTPDRPVLFEFFLNDRLYQRLVPELAGQTSEYHNQLRRLLAFQRAGYDYANILPPGFRFKPGNAHPESASISQNAGSVIHSQADVDRYAWPDPAGADLELVEQLGRTLPPGMKLILYGPGGVLENAIELVGYEDLCVMIKQDEVLAMRIFGEVGARLEAYYQRISRLDCVGACISNDDWGFKTHTLFNPVDMRRFVFGWHERIVRAIHAGGKPAILHSCGHFEKVIDDIINGMGYDARHSYEDGILPVEAAYERYGGRIAILGGLDLDFVCRSTPQAITARAQAMLARSAARGSYALGTGNSVPEYVPDENYFAMIQAAIDAW